MKLWIARDVCNIHLKLFFEEPVEQEGNWVVVKHIDKLNRMYYGNSISIDNHLFPEVTYKNSPQEVELKLCYQTETIKLDKCNPKAQPCVLTNYGIDTNVIKFD